MCQSFKVLPHAKRAAQEEAGCSCHAPWLLSMCLHQLQDLLMLQLVHRRAEPWLDGLAPSVHHPSPRGASPQATGCHRFASRVVAVGYGAFAGWHVPWAHHPGHWGGFGRLMGGYFHAGSHTQIFCSFNRKNTCARPE